MSADVPPTPALERPVRVLLAARARQPAAPPRPAAPSRPSPDTETRWISAGGIRALVTQPAVLDRPPPVVLYLPGLTWAGDRPTADRGFVRELALGADAAVLVPDVWQTADGPSGALEACRRTVLWIREHGGTAGLDGSRLAGIGGSTGGLLLAGLGVPAGRRGGGLDHQVLMYPILDSAPDTESGRCYAAGFLVDETAVRRGWDRYAPDPAARADPALHPARATAADLAGGPPTLLVTAEADPHRDTAEEYAARLDRAGVPVTRVRYLGVVHGFVTVEELRTTRAARAARVQIVDTVHVALHSTGPASVG